MPFRCETCQFLSKDDDNPSCEQREKCNFQRVAVIHYCSIEGQFTTVGEVVATVSQGQSELQKTEPILVKAHCEGYTQGAMMTDYLGGATCLDCLATIPPKEE